MLSTLRFTSTDATRVEETWQTFVPSANLQKVDPDRFAFHWSSAGLADLTVVEYELRADVHSVVEPEDQLLVSGRRTGRRGGIGT